MSDPAPGDELIVLGPPELRVVVRSGPGMPELLSVGPEVGRVGPEWWTPAVQEGGLDVAVPLGMVVEEAAGPGVRPGVVGCRPDGSGWSPRFGLVERVVGATGVTFRLADPVAELELEVRISVGDVVVVSVSLTNTGTSDYQLLRLSPSVPVSASATELVTFRGRWSREFQLHRHELVGTRLVESRRGRTSHQSSPALVVGSGGFGETHGEVLGAQLAWSGNHELVAEVLPDGRRHLQLGELLAPGEVVLGPGESFEAPDVVIAWSPAGLNGVSQAFHAHTRRRLGPLRPRPVVLNTWEAVYFDHGFATLSRLADVAAEVGVERFVLDDGWFGSRRDATSGLGDWTVSPVVWPDGLHPLIEHVTGLGMEFGLWVEPEMVNPDSDLFRAHPEWTNAAPGYEPLLGRHQLVLDLGRPEVRDHLVDVVCGLLAEHDISYLKWDMNRDLVQATHAGRAAAHHHVVGVYEVLDRVRAEHPNVEIESCAGGGGRVDLGILGRTQRFWASDCNDAVERQAIQRGASVLFPPEVTGTHIGPFRAHTTGRHQSLPFRAATALFGHLGIEWNLLEATPEERDLVRRTVSLHRRLRPLLHGGRLVRGDHPDPAVLVHGVVADDRRRAVLAVVQLATSSAEVPAPARLPGLDPDLVYELRVVDDLGPVDDLARGRPGWMAASTPVSGSFLGAVGLPLPVLRPESVLLVELTADPWDDADPGDA